MTFLKGTSCELRVLEKSDHEIQTWTRAVNAGLTTQHLITGSRPMKAYDVKAYWDAEEKAGSTIFGVWTLETELGVICAKCSRQWAVDLGGAAGRIVKCPGCNTEKTIYVHSDSSIPRFIGTCGLHSFRDIYHSYEARFLIFDPDAVGKGIGKEACKMLVSYAFMRLNAHRVWLGVSEDNTRALKCYIDCGFKYEGRLREELYYDGKYHDALRFAILKDEHEA